MQHVQIELPQILTENCLYFLFDKVIIVDLK